MKINIESNVIYSSVNFLIDVNGFFVVFAKILFCMESYSLFLFRNIRTLLDGQNIFLTSKSAFCSDLISTLNTPCLMIMHNHVIILDILL
jgi:hypothetical protein